ncbi:hypothetical protein GBAR_LOCUS20823 [Geodia barretti]|uniref:Uncharacterized protein n=1 Tax=Geodia barretti TaxID=519541 RepID=A0AA35X292_GEOBA|nr:hypothetical protein GBAR_LOCUS20823 [Geodia barretti]
MVTVKLQIRHLMEIYFPLILPRQLERVSATWLSLPLMGINVASLNGSGDITPTKPPTPREEKESISTGVAVGISTIITLLVSLPVGVVIGSCGTLFAIRRGGGRGERKRKKKKEEFGGAIYEEPVHSVETAIPLSENQAYGQVSSQR